MVRKTKPLLEFKCPECGKTFRDYRKRKYCSLSCATKHRIKLGELKPRIINKEFAILGLKAHVEKAKVKYFEIFSKLTDVEKGYIAGLIDGDGYIGITKNHGRLTADVQIFSTDRKLMDWLLNRLKVGCVYVKRKGENRKPLYCWRMMSVTGVFVLLHFIKEYLVIKKERAEIIYQFCKLKLESLGEETPEMIELFNKLKFQKIGVCR